MQRLFAFFCVALWLVGVGLNPAQAFEIQEVKSKSGLTAWLVQDSTIPLVVVNFAFGSGSAADKPGKEGTAHFLTGMMDEGTAELKGDAFQAKRDDLGIVLSFDARTTRYTGMLQTTTEHRETAFDLLRAALTSLTLPDEAIERMRKNFVVAAQSELNEPGTIASRILFTNMIGEHPYSRPGRGTPQSIEAITRQDLVDIAKTIFSRRDLKIAVVGDITAEELAKRLDDVFGALPDTPHSTIQPATVARPGKLQVIEKPIPQTMIMFGTTGLDISDSEFLSAFVMSEILGGNSEAWLSDEVREKRGFTYGIGFSLLPLPQAPLYLGSFNTSNATAGEAMKVVRETIQRMADTGPTQEQLDSFKTFLTGSFALRFDSGQKIAEYLLDQQVRGRGRDYVNKRNDLINAVTLDQVKQQAKRLLDLNALHVVAVGKPIGLN
jgi:zinc protease